MAENGTLEKGTTILGIGQVITGLQEIFRLKHSLTSEEVEERRTLQARYAHLVSLGSELTAEELGQKGAIYARLRELAEIKAKIEGHEGRKLTPELEAKWLKLTAFLLGIREQPGKSSQFSQRDVAFGVIGPVWGKGANAPGF